MGDDLILAPPAQPTNIDSSPGRLSLVPYPPQVGIFNRRGRPGTLRPAVSEDRQHLEQFVSSRSGVEAYVEPRTAVTETTVVLVAATGEWTRRRVPSPKTAHEWANALGIPSYDAAVVGYPQRMRDWTARRSAAEKERRRKLLDSD